MSDDHESARKLTCGNCGGAEHTLYKTSRKIFTVCCKCGVRSWIAPEASLKIEWDSEGSPGVLGT